jgi:hypothetical protein
VLLSQNPRLGFGTALAPAGGGHNPKERDMSHLATLFRSMSSMFCDHEWVRRRDTGHVYLECVRCLSTTPGIQYGRERAEHGQPTRGSLEVVEAH